jgi:RNA polymerase sigma factor (sigma-70 family)
MNSLDKTFLTDINQNIGIVHRVCRVYFAYDVAEREDVFQEILYQLWKSYPNFLGDSKFSTWMYRVALNTAITHARKIRRAPEKEKLTDRTAQIADPVDSGDGEESIVRLYAGIQSLTDVDKAIILLYLEENSYEEIASVTGLTKTNVSVRLVRIKKALEEKLKSSH